MERIPEQKVVFDSRDMDVHGEFDTIEPLQATGDPYDPFAFPNKKVIAKMQESICEITVAMAAPEIPI